MRRLTGLILTGLIVIAVSSALAQPPGDPDAAAPGETITGIVQFEGSWAYAGPDFAYEVVGQLQQNTSVTVMGRRGDFYYTWDGNQWLQIQFGGGSAWVYARLIRTSIPFNSIPPTGRQLPRNRDGRVPKEFDLSENVCDRWVGTFTQSGDFMAGDTIMTVTYPAMPGTTIYSVIVIAPDGFRTAFDSETTTAEIELERLPIQEGTYTWRVVPYWTSEEGRYNWQQICLLQTGGTFQVPVPPRTPLPPRYRYGGYYTPQPRPTLPPLVP